LDQGCRIDAIEACTTITQIHLDGQLLMVNNWLQSVCVTAEAAGHHDAQRALARVAANPLGDELRAMMRQFDNCPTGRCMLARYFPAIASFFKIKRTDATTSLLVQTRFYSRYYSRRIPLPTPLRSVVAVTKCTCERQGYYIFF
jgi:hypothetical protein